MFSSILVRYKTHLLCTALCSTLIISGCTFDNISSDKSKLQQTGAEQTQRYQTIIDASKGEPSPEVLRAYIALEPLLTEPSAHQKNIDSTWLMLTRFTPQAFNNMMINADEVTLNGWSDLYIIYQQNMQDPTNLQNAVNDWKLRYPQHPAALTLPQGLVQAMQRQLGSNANVALFLPLSGPAQVFGNAIYQGFSDAQNNIANFSASYVNIEPKVSAAPNTDINAETVDIADTDVDSQENNEENESLSSQETQVSSIVTTEVPPITAESVTINRVKVYDTNSQPIEALLAQAQQDGMDLIVGPLLKNDVIKVTSANTPFNILALNELDSPVSKSNVCYFSLSPEDEARNAVAHIKSDNKSNPLVLTPDNAFGKRIAQSFADEWQKEGGGVVLHQTFGSDLKSIVSRNGLRLSGTPINPKSTANNDETITLGDLTIPIATPQVSGGPIDSVYIIATADELAYIKPMIDMAGSSRNRPALYASSRSNQAGSGSDFRFEMEDLQFSEVPLLAGNNPSLMNKASNKFANDYSLVRLYAMGMDAWRLANQFNELPQHQLNIKGASGNLTVGDNCTIIRQLSWTQFKQGRMDPLP